VDPQVLLQIAILRELLLAHVALVRFVASVPAIVQREARLVRELLPAQFAEILLLACVSGLMIQPVGLGLETVPTHVANKRPVVRVNQLMALQKLLVFEAFVALVADEPASIVVFGFFVVNDRARVVQNFAANIAFVAAFSVAFDITFVWLWFLLCLKARTHHSAPSSINTSFHTLHEITSC